MPRADRFPKHFDHALRCREQNLPDTADFIHKIGKASDEYKRALVFCINVMEEYKSDLTRPKSARPKGDLTPFMLGALDKARETLRDYDHDVVSD